MPLAEPLLAVFGVAPRLFGLVDVRQLAALPNSDRSGPPGTAMRERLVLLLTFGASNAANRSPTK